MTTHPPESPDPTIGGGQFAEIADLVGEELAAVSFVRDYVEFQFDGPCLRSLSDPVAHLAGIDYEFPLAGARDAFCTLIGRSVASATESPEELRLAFDDGSELSIPLWSSTAGAEAAHLVPSLPNGSGDMKRMSIWENAKTSSPPADQS